MVNKIVFITLLFISFGILSSIHAETKDPNNSREERAQQLQILDDALDSKPDPNTDLKTVVLPSTEGEASLAASGCGYGCHRICNNTPYGNRCRCTCSNIQPEPGVTPLQESVSPTPF